MNQTFTFKTLLITLLVMICCAVKAETVQYKTNDGFTYEIDLETQEASLNKYWGNATNVVVPEKIAYEGKEYKVTILGYKCFSGCSSLVSVNIPSSVTILGYGCFSGCSSLVSVEIPSSVTILGGFCFEGCRSLVSVNIPSSVTNLGESCFWGCLSLEMIVVDANNPCYDSREGCNAIIETASNTMIAGCKNTVIPSSVTSLGDNCFGGCSSLALIDIPSSVTSLGDNCFGSCSSLASIDIPSSVTSLGDNCFGGCSSLASIDIPSSVTSLGWFCFAYCRSLASIDIPSSVTSIGDDCFSECNSLKTVICRMENVKSGNFFGYGYDYGTPIENATLYVPESLLTTYQTTEPWSRFGTILPLTEEVELGISDTSKPAVSLWSDNGSVVLSGLTDGTPVSYYSVDGRLLGRTSVNNGSASFSVKPNSIVTVKAGKQSFKVCVK